MTNPTKATKGVEYATRETFGRFLTQLAEAIETVCPGGEGVTVTTDEAMRSIELARGGVTMRVHFNTVGRYANPYERLSVSVADPAFRVSYDHDGCPQATISTNRSPETLARDLWRRVIASGWDYVARRLARVERAEEASKDVNRCAQGLRDATWWRTTARAEATVREPRSIIAIHGRFQPSGRYVSGVIAVGPDGETGPVVDLDLHGLSEDQAKAVLTLLN